MSRHCQPPAQYTIGHQPSTPSATSPVHHQPAAQYTIGHQPSTPPATSSTTPHHQREIQPGTIAWDRSDLFHIRSYSAGENVQLSTDFSRHKHAVKSQRNHDDVSPMSGSKDISDDHWDSDLKTVVRWTNGFKNYPECESLVAGKRDISSLMQPRILT